MTRSDIFWTADSNSIKSYFSEFLRDNYPDFRFQFDWKDFPQVEDYLIRLMFNSFSNSSQVRTKLPDLMLDVELFLLLDLH